MRATGLKPGDSEWVRNNNDNEKVDEELVDSIKAVGFSRNAAL